MNVALKDTKHICISIFNHHEFVASDDIAPKESNGNITTILRGYDRDGDEVRRVQLFTE